MVKVIDTGKGDGNEEFGKFGTDTDCGSCAIINATQWKTNKRALSMLGKIFSRRHMQHFSYFSQKISFDICLRIISLLFAEYSHRVLKYSKSHCTAALSNQCLRSPFAVSLDTIDISSHMEYPDQTARMRSLIYVLVVR